MNNFRLNLFSPEQLQGFQDFGNKFKQKASEFTGKATDMVKEGVSRLEEHKNALSLAPRLQSEAPDDSNPVRQAVVEVLPLSEEPFFCFEALVKEYVNSFEQGDFEQELKKIEQKSMEAPDREAFVKKALSNLRLDQAIKQWGAAIIKKAHGEFFLDQVRDGRRDFYFEREVPKGGMSTDLMRFNIGCDSAKKRLQLDNKLYLERVVKEMRIQFPGEIIQEVVDDLDYDITTGDKRVKREEFRGECQRRYDEVLRIQEKAEVEQLFMIHQLSEVYSTVLQKVNDKNPQKFNLALTKALIGWVSENIDKQQISETLASAFAHMGLMVGEGVTPTNALNLADKHQKVLAKTEPFEAFKLAIFPEDTQLETFDMN